MGQWSDAYAASVFGPSGAPGPDARLTDPNDRMMFIEVLNNIRQYKLGREKTFYKHRIEILREQNRAAQILLKYQTDRASIQQRDVDSIRKSVTAFRKDILGAQTQLERSRATFDDRAMSRAGAAYDSATGPSSARITQAWKAVADSLLEAGTKDVLSAQLPKTTEKMLNEYRALSEFSVDDHGYISVKWNAQDLWKITDPVIKDQIRRMVRDSNIVASQRRDQAVNLERAKNELDKELGLLRPGASEADKTRILDKAQGYAEEVLRINNVPQAETAKARFEEEERKDEHYQQLHVERDILHERLFGEKADAGYMDKRGQTIRNIIDDGWAADHGFDIGRLGVALDVDGDGFVDSYAPGPDDSKLIRAWGRQYDRGAGRYGVFNNGRTGAVVEFKVRPTEEALASLRDDQGNFNYILKEDGTKVFKSREQISQENTPPASYFVVLSDKVPAVPAVVNADGTVFVKEANSLLFRAASEEEAAAAKAATKHHISGLSVQAGDSVEEKIDLTKKWSPPTYEQQREIPEEALITRTGERMKANAADSIQHPEGGFRIRGEGFISSRDIVGEVDVVYQEADIKLLGPTGLFQRRRAEINRAANERLLEQREGMKPVTRVVGGVTYQDFGPMAESRLQAVFGAVFPVERKALKLDRKEKEDLAGNLRAELEENPEDEATALQLEALDEELAQERVTRRDKRRLEELRAARGQLHEEDVSDLAELEEPPEETRDLLEARAEVSGLFQIGEELPGRMAGGHGFGWHADGAIAAGDPVYMYTSPDGVLYVKGRGEPDSAWKEVEDEATIQAAKDAWGTTSDGPSPIDWDLSDWEVSRAYEIDDPTVPEEPIAALATDAMEKKARQQAALDAAKRKARMGRPGEEKGKGRPAVLEAEKRAMEEGKTEQEEYESKYTEWEAGGKVGDPPARPVSFLPEPSERVFVAMQAASDLEKAKTSYRGEKDEDALRAAYALVQATAAKLSEDDRKAAGVDVFKAQQFETYLEEAKKGAGAKVAAADEVSEYLESLDIEDAPEPWDLPPPVEGPPVPMPSLEEETLGGMPRAAKHPVVEGFQKWAATRPGRKLSERLKARKEKEPESPTSELRPGADVVPTKGYA